MPRVTGALSCCSTALMLRHFVPCLGPAAEAVFGMQLCVADDAPRGVHTALSVHMQSFAYIDPCIAWSVVAGPCCSASLQR